MSILSLKRVVTIGLLDVSGWARLVHAPRLGARKKSIEKPRAKLLRCIPIWHGE